MSTPRREGGSALVIEGLHAGIIGGREILRGVDLVVPSGEVHAVMGRMTIARWSPAQVSMATGLDQVWVFIVFPIVGGILGAAVWKVLRPESDEEPLVESEEVAPGPYGKRAMPGQ